MAGNSDGLIDAFAAALAQALAAHGVSPTDGNATVRATCEELCRDWGGESHWLPKAWRTGRESAVVSAVESGATLTEAARQAGVHRHTARKIIRQSAGLGREDWVL